MADQILGDNHERNAQIHSFFEFNIDSESAIRRFKEFRKNLEADKDHVRVHGQYYNNIYLGKRIFGPAKKQMFTSTIAGGMERRFEIIDNQVNHIPFTSDASIKNGKKCRNPRIKCRDDTRVVLKAEDFGDSDFIHANYVQGGPLFNRFILTQSPMDNTIYDFWRMVIQENVGMVILMISRSNINRCARFWPTNGNIFSFGNIVVSTQKVERKGTALQHFSIKVHKFDRITHETSNHMTVQLFQGDLNDSDNLQVPIMLLNHARNMSRPTVVIDHLGVSRAACLIAVEICIMSMIKGPSYKHPVQRSVQFLRSCRSFAIETPMQYIYIHRVVLHALRKYVGISKAFEEDYEKWLGNRSQRLFLDEPNGPIAPHRLLSPRVDPDLLTQARLNERPNFRREMHSHVGELPPTQDLSDSKSKNLVQLPNKFPRGRRYLY